MVKLKIDTGPKLLYNQYIDSDIAESITHTETEIVMSYSYYKKVSGGYMVTHDDEPIWEVRTLKQAREDVRDLNAEDIKRCVISTAAPDWFKDAMEKGTMPIFGKKKSYLSKKKEPA